MKKRVIFLSFFLFLSVSACSPKSRIMELQKIETMKEFAEYNPVRVEGGMFYFTTLEEEGMNVYAMDLKTTEVIKLFSEIHQYSSFIPLLEEEAIVVDQEGNLYHKKGEEEINIDHQITGLNSPNVLISPQRNGILYTKGNNEDSSVYLYIFGEKRPRLIKNSISEEAYTTFQFTTQWSNERNYFVFNNNEVYNNEGQKIATIEATSVKWSPNDEYIAYIQKPDDLQKNQVIIGEWYTYIGRKFALHKVDEGIDEVILKSQHDLVDPIDTIQWSCNSENVAILEGTVKRGANGSLEKIDYQGVQVYNIQSQDLSRIEKLKLNFYQLLFTDYIYGKRLGQNGPLEIYKIDKEKDLIFENPLMLNNKELFIIHGKERAYLIDGVKLIEVDSKGKERSLIKLPWQPNFMFLDEENKALIIINKDKEMYRYPL